MHLLPSDREKRNAVIVVLYVILGCISFFIAGLMFGILCAKACAP